MNDEIILSGTQLVGELFADWCDYGREGSFEDYAPEINRINPNAKYICNADLSEIYEILEGDYL